MERSGLLAEEPQLPPSQREARVGRRSRLFWSLGAAASAAAVVATGGIAWHPASTGAPRTAGERKAAVDGVQELVGVPGAGGGKVHLPGGPGAPKSADGNDEVQELVDKVKANASAVLEEQGWQFDVDSLKAASYCTQIVAGMNYIVKVNLTDDKVLQLTIYKPLPSSGQEVKLLSADVLAAADGSCVSPALKPPAPVVKPAPESILPAPVPLVLPHVALNATAGVQKAVDSVKESVPKLLAISGWKLNLDPYKALSYCGDLAHMTVKVDVNSPTDPPLFLQLLIRKEKKPVLVSALMVRPVEGSCFSLPVLPALVKPAAPATKGGKAAPATKGDKAAPAAKGDEDPDAELIIEPTPKPGATEEPEEEEE